MVSVSVEGIVYAANTNNMQFPPATTRMHMPHTAHTHIRYTHIRNTHSGQKGSRWKVNHLHEHQASWQLATDARQQLATNWRRLWQPAEPRRKPPEAKVLKISDCLWRPPEGDRPIERERERGALGRCQTPSWATAAAGGSYRLLLGEIIHKPKTIVYILTYDMRNTPDKYPWINWATIEVIVH